MTKYIVKQKAISALINEANTHSNPVKRAYTRAAALIEQITAEDVQTVRRGRWIDIYEWAKMHDSTPSGMCTYFWCSECQKEQEKKSNYCPNCGAKMIKDGDTNG